MMMHLIILSVQYFHTIKSILNIKMTWVTIADMQYFHTIKSILNNIEQS